MTIVYQAYGLKEVMRQTLFSISSLFNKIGDSSEIKVAVYTDDPNFFSQFFGEEKRVELQQISSEQIKKWRGPIDFVHRVKIEVLKDAAQKYSGPLFYADGDTYFMSNPLPLFQKVNDTISILHTAETELCTGKDPLTKKMKAFVAKNTFKVDGEQIAVGTETVMWNAGVIGVSERNKKLLNKILQMTDDMHAKYPKHVTEQLSVSFMLQTNTKVIAADQVIYHYWNQKPEYQEAIDIFLNNNKTLKEAVACIEKFPYPGPPEKKRGFLGKILKRSKIFGLHRSH